VRRVPEGILDILKRGAEEFKAEVDKDNESGFPIMSLLVLAFIALVLYLIWDKLNQRIEPSKRHSSSSSPSLFSSSGPGYLFGGSSGNGFKGKDF
jgi:hypothetical protein